MNMQTKVLAKLKEMAELRSLDFVHNTQWANTGDVQMMDDDFNTYVEFSYSFQSGYFTVHLESNDGSENERFYIHNNKIKEIQHFFKYIEDLLEATCVT